MWGLANVPTWSVHVLEGVCVTLSFLLLLLPGSMLNSLLCYVLSTTVVQHEHERPKSVDLPSYVMATLKTEALFL